MSRRSNLLAIALVACLCSSTTSVFAAMPTAPMSAGELELALSKLRVLGSVLYLGAHPDDENTAMLAYFSKERRMRTGYLSLTRGDGGQNLIGTETGTLLGVIRTQELMAARRLDGGEQFFSRALDFGYSKTTDETLAKWGGEEILHDVVWVFRRYRPDIVITRFTPTLGGHGHHTASAQLAAEAFEAAADPQRFPEQLRHVEPWQVKRLFWNAWRPSPEEAAAMPSMDLGTYNPLLGRAYTEISAESRSQHKSQGFGSSGFRGELTNYLQLTKGDEPNDDAFDGIDTGWSRVAGGERMDALLEKAQRGFASSRPAAILPTLIEAYGVLAALEDDPWIEVKRNELLEVIRSCAGLWVEAIAAKPTTHPGEALAVTASIVNRSEFPMTLERIVMPLGATARVPERQRVSRGRGPENPDAGEVVSNRELTSNHLVAGEANLELPGNIALTQPFWLHEPPTGGRFAFDDLARIGVPENEAALTVRFVVSMGSQRMGFDAPIVYRWTDRVDGERYRPLEIVPPLTCEFDQGVYVFPTTDSREVQVVVRGASGSTGSVRLDLPRGWKASPARADFRLAEGATQQIVRFTVGPPARGTMERAPMRAAIHHQGDVYTQSLVRIDYDHIPMQTLLPPAEATLVRADVRRSGESIGYVMGSGDRIPEALGEMGYQVTLLSDDDLEKNDLSSFDAIVCGIRAYNTRERLAGLQSRLLGYVENGGTLVVQYNTSRGFEVQLGPHPLTLSRDRVTVEEAPIRFADAQHPLLTTPNKITAADFENWVQERGLYFANEWDEKYDAVLSSNDPGEEPKDGGMLYARHGKGVFIYSGYSWFRQLPAGVPGAYRLFANLVSGGK